MLLYLMTRSPLERRDERGASAVEYGLLLAGVTALIVAAVYLFGDAVLGLFTDTCTSVGTEMTVDCT